MPCHRVRLAVGLGMIALTVAMADDISQSDVAIRELIRQGAVVKRFAVVESETSGLLVRLKSEHMDRQGKINSDILRCLGQLDELVVELRGLPFSDEGLKSLMDSVRLVGMDVSGSAISDRGLRRFATARTSLRLLDLSFTKISDDGLRSLSSQTQLRHLSIIGCPVTDDATAALVNLRQLREAYLAKTGISPQATDQLRCCLPACRIER